MKKTALLLYVSALLLLSGCSADLFSSHSDVEKLRPIQTIGLDRQDEGVLMSISSGVGPEQSAPLVMKAAASGIETAITRLQAYSSEDRLFYAHVRYILLGETMASESILPLLDWVERSPSMRMDTALLIVKGSAADAVTDATTDSTDITKRLTSLEQEELLRGQHIYSLREVAVSLLERGYALCLAVQSLPSEGTIYTESELSDAVVPSGYAVLREGELAAYLSQNETLGVQLLDEAVNGTHVTVAGNTLELLSCGADVSGRWGGDGTLEGVDIRCELQAGVLERGPEAEEDIEALQRALSETAESWLLEAAAHAQAIGCDFLDLRSAAMKNAPKGASDVNWEELTVRASVRGEINRSYDLSQ